MSLDLDAGGIIGTTRAGLSIQTRASHLEGGTTRRRRFRSGKAAPTFLVPAPPFDLRFETGNASKGIIAIPPKCLLDLSPCPLPSLPSSPLRSVQGGILLATIESWTHFPRKSFSSSLYTLPLHRLSRPTSGKISFISTAHLARSTALSIHVPILISTLTYSDAPSIPPLSIADSRPPSSTQLPSPTNSSVDGSVYLAYGDSQPLADILGLQGNTEKLISLRTS